MDEYDDIEVRPVFLPGVDLTLWFGVVAALVAIVAGLTVLVVLP